MSPQRARYEFKRKLEELRGIRGRGTELVSLYLTPDKNLNDAMNQVRSELGQAQNIKSKSTKKNVSSALETIVNVLKNYKKVPANGLVLMAGHKALSGDQTEMVQFILEPPDPVPVNIYRCDSAFFLEPLESMVTEKDTYGLVVIDRQEATLGFLKGQRVDVVKNFQSLVPRKHSKGGQSAHRFERLIEEAATNFFKEVAEKADEIFLAREGMRGILVGGPGHTKIEWAEGEFLHHELQKRIVDTFDVGYTDEYGLRELVEAAHSTLEEVGLTAERDLMKRFLQEVRKTDGLFTYGEKEVREHLQLGAVNVLILSESLRRWRVALSCNQCGHAWEQTSTDLEAFKDKPPQCPACKQAVAKVGAAIDVVDELTALADQMGTRVEIVSVASEEGQMLMSAFGGIAGILRYRPHG